MPRNYGDGSNSQIGVQLVTELVQKKALTEARRKSFFGQLAETVDMPKHMGKTIKKYHYLPMLHDANNNDQGIDASGNVTTLSRTIQVKPPTDITPAQGTADGTPYTSQYFTVEGSDAAAMLVLLKAQVVAWAKRAKSDGGLGLSAELAGTADANYDELSTTGGDGSGYDLGYRFIEHDAVPRHGNMYGSSKDIGTITAKLPALTENGGRVNRVGFKRISLEGTIHKFGFFDEYTQESLDFDSDAQMMMHVNREMLNGAHEMTEAALQIDIVNSAGVLRFGGEATSASEVTGENGATASVISYSDLQKLAIDLDNNRCPKNTTIITGTRLTDVKPIKAARYLYIGNELQTQVEDMVDNFGDRAFTPIHKYASQGTVAEGEIGSIGGFRIIVVEEMLHWAGAGATVSNNDGYRETDGSYDIFPMLVVGDASFTTIGFQSSGKKVKFTIFHKKPGKETADKTDPYGEQGFMSIKWYYGFMALRPERIALCKTVAPWG